MMAWLTLSDACKCCPAVVAVPLAPPTKEDCSLFIVWHSKKTLRPSVAPSPLGDAKETELSTWGFWLLFLKAGRKETKKKKNVCKRHRPSGAQALPASVCRRNAIFCAHLFLIPSVFPHCRGPTGSLFLALSRQRAGWLAKWAADALREGRRRLWRGRFLSNLLLREHQDAT